MRFASSRLVRLKLAASTGEIIAHRQATNSKSKPAENYTIRETGKKNVRRRAPLGFSRLPSKLRRE
jgi:hypothetical protein